jgi:undecaprenyl-diphosphatase
MPSHAERTDRQRLLEALALGVLHGPAELLPVSSSAHVAIVPWLLGRDRGRDDDELEKSLEVALHAGTALALLIVLRAEVTASLRGLDRRRVLMHLAASVPPSVAGLAFERPIEAHLGTPLTTAAGLAGGAAAMLIADRGRGRRGSESAGLTDGVWLGFAQACALVPGISRSGATLAALRARGFGRPDAARLSRETALPIIVGATALKTVRLAQRRVEPRVVTPLAVGAGAAFASTVLARGLIARLESDRPLAPYAVYRLALATAITVRSRTQKWSPLAGDRQY